MLRLVWMRSAERSIVLLYATPLRLLRLSDLAWAELYMLGPQSTTRLPSIVMHPFAALETAYNPALPPSTRKKPLLRPGRIKRLDVRDRCWSDYSSAP